MRYKTTGAKTYKEYNDAFDAIQERYNNGELSKEKFIDELVDWKRSGLMRPFGFSFMLSHEEKAEMELVQRHHNVLTVMGIVRFLLTAELRRIREGDDS